jgi:hypothetical protein
MGTRNYPASWIFPGNGTAEAQEATVMLKAGPVILKAGPVILKAGPVILKAGPGWPLVAWGR